MTTTVEERFASVPALLAEVRENAGWLIALGILTILAGTFAIAAPLVAGTAATLVIGVLLLVSGGFELVGAFKAKGWKQGLLGFASAALSVVGGLLVLAHPLLGLAAIALLLAAYFLADGVAKVVLALRMRAMQGWGWILCGGIVTVLLGLLIWMQWPLSGAWAVGILLGVNMIFSGWSMALLGFAARRGR